MGFFRDHIGRLAAMAALVGAVAALSACSGTWAPKQYFFLNDLHFNLDYKSINETFGPQYGCDPAVGQAVLIYLLHQPLEVTLDTLKSHFAEAEKYDIPVFVELDPITFWNDVPWIWNWFDPSKPGYDPSNRDNVEWYGWGPEYAVKIGWLNWGAQCRLDPMANLFSPVYQEEVAIRMKAVLSLVEDWYWSLPKKRRYLLGGIKLTGELGYGYNNWYYPDGNDYYDKPESESPQTGVKYFDPPSRGVCQTGYAALTYSGIRTEGEVTAEDIFEIERHFFDFVIGIASGYSFPRELLYVHSCGPADELKAGLRPGACPSWTVYWERAQHPEDWEVGERIREEIEAPCWGFAEWNIGSDKTEKEWLYALTNCLSFPKCRFITLFNIDFVIRPDGTVYDPAVSALKSIQRREL